MNKKTNPIMAALAVGLLVIVGVLTLLSAPHPTKHTNTARTAQIVTTVTLSPTSARTPLVRANISHVGSDPTAQPTATPQTTVLPTDTPTDTPTPAPTDTPTPTPSWHVVGAYSGTGPTSDFVTLSNVTGNGSNVQIQWTCQDPSGQWQIGFSVTPAGGGQGGTGEGTFCGGVGALSGSYILSADTSVGGTTWDVSMTDVADAGGPWTATVSIWY